MMLVSAKVADCDTQIACLLPLAHNAMIEG
jgi:hypothetical protein